MYSSSKLFGTNLYIPVVIVVFLSNPCVHEGMEEEALDLVVVTIVSIAVVGDTAEVTEEEGADTNSGVEVEVMTGGPN